jgi:outer membrane protein assembly factor BamB
VLAAVVVASVAVRLRGPASPRPSAAARASASHVTTTAPSGSPGGLSSPLRSPAASPSAAAASPSAAAAPRMIHGGPRHLHRSGARGPRAVRVGWRAQIGGPIAAQVTASPDERTLYASTLTGSVVALGRDDGKTRWAAELGERVYSTPLVHDDGTLYVGSDAKRLVALSPEGRVLWRLEVEGEVDSGATFGSDGTIVFAAGPFVHAVRRGGDLAWRFAARNKVFTSPAVTGQGRIVFGSQDDHVRALGPGGALLWSTDLGADVDGAAVIGDDDAVYVGTDKGEVVRLDASGRVVWRTNVGGFVRGVLSLAGNGDVLAGTYGPVPRVVRLAPDGAIRGGFAIQGTGAREFGIHGSPLEDGDGSLYFGAQDDAVYAIDPDGAVKWRFETGADVDAPLTMLGDGSLVIPSEDGTITMLLP